MLQATEQGLGLAVVRELLAADALRDGRLARLFDVSVVLDGVQPYSLVYPPALANWPPLIALRDWVRHEFDCSLALLHAPEADARSGSARADVDAARRRPWCRPWARRTSPAPGRLPAARRPCRARGPAWAARPTRRSSPARPRNPATGACCSGPRWPGWRRAASARCRDARGGWRCRCRSRPRPPARRAGCGRAATRSGRPASCARRAAGATDPSGRRRAPGCHRATGRGWWTTRPRACRRRRTRRCAPPSCRRSRKGVRGRLPSRGSSARRSARRRRRPRVVQRGQGLAGASRRVGERECGGGDPRDRCGDCQLAPEIHRDVPDSRLVDTAESAADGHDFAPLSYMLRANLKGNMKGLRQERPAFTRFYSTAKRGISRQLDGNSRLAVERQRRMAAGSQSSVRSAQTSGNSTVSSILRR